MSNRNTSFPSAAASAFGSRKTTVGAHRNPDFSDSAAAAFNRRSTTAQFPESFHKAKHGSGSGADFDPMASTAFGQKSRDTGAGFGSGSGSGSGSSAFGGGRAQGFDERASSAFGGQKRQERQDRQDRSSMPPPLPRNSLAAQISLVMGDEASNPRDRTKSALFKPKAVVEQTQEEMFPALSPKTPVAPVIPVVAKPVNFADLVKKRAQQDAEEERVRLEKEALLLEEKKKNTRDRVQFVASSIIRNTHTTSYDSGTHEDDLEETDRHDSLDDMYIYDNSRSKKSRAPVLSYHEEADEHGDLEEDAPYEDDADNY